MADLRAVCQPVAIRVGLERIGAAMDLVAVAETVAVRVGLQRVSATTDLVAVLEAVVVGIGVVRIGSELELAAVTQIVAVGVDCCVADDPTERPRPLLHPFRVVIRLGTGLDQDLAGSAEGLDVRPAHGHLIRTVNRRRAQAGIALKRIHGGRNPPVARLGLLRSRHGVILAVRPRLSIPRAGAAPDIRYHVAGSRPGSLGGPAEVAASTPRKAGIDIDAVLRVGAAPACDAAPARRVGRRGRERGSLRDVVAQLVGQIGRVDGRLHRDRPVPLTVERLERSARALSRMINGRSSRPG